MIEVGRNCLECSRLIDEFRHDSAKYCCEACRQRARYRRRDKKRALRKTLESARKRKDKRCRRCNANISQRRGSAIYCSNNCREIAYLARQREITRTRTRLCRKCRHPISRPRIVCDQCLSLSKKASGWKAYLNGTNVSLEQQIQRQAAKRRAKKKHITTIRAAYIAFRELCGEYGQPLSKPEGLSCIVCGIELTGWRTRMCGSQSCRAARARIERRKQYLRQGGGGTREERVVFRPSFPGKWWRLPDIGTYQQRKPQPRNSVPPCIVDGPGDWKSTKAIFRPAFPGKWWRNTSQRKLYRSRGQTDRSRYEYAVYRAMRELNLVPAMEKER
jgi:hypothetical protein